MLELYTMATPNGQKASIVLEELALPYTPHTINILKGDQFTPEFLKISPNGKIPALVDTESYEGKPLAIMESGAILIYLAEKTGRLLSSDLRKRQETLQWLFFQVGHIGPMFGQFGHFYKYAKEQCDHPYPVERYTKEAKRLLGVLDKRLSHSGDWIVGAYSIADIAIAPWVHGLSAFYQAEDTLELKSFVNIQKWLERFLKRPAVSKGLTVGDIDD